MTPLPAGNGETWLTLTEAAGVIGISPARLSLIVKAGRIAHTRNGRSVHILKTAALAYKKLPRKPGRPKK